MATPRAALTYEDFLAMPEDNSRRHEILDGELVVSPTPVTLHQRIVGRLFVLLDAHVRSQGLGEVFVSPIAVVLANTSVVGPDLVYVASDRTAVVKDRGIEGAPTLAIEVSSPSTRRLDRRRKFEVYARYGVPHYWIVDTGERAIEAYDLADGAYRLARRAAGDDPVRLPPFGELSFATASLWRP
jgi:Uma2 family endonuclease